MPQNYKILYNGTVERFAQVKSVLTYLFVRFGTFAFQITLLCPFFRILDLKEKAPSVFGRCFSYLSTNIGGAPKEELLIPVKKLWHFACGTFAGKASIKEKI